MLNAASLKLTDIGSTGIESAMDSETSVDVRYYELSGREVNSSAKGILLKKSVYGDGFTKTVKSHDR